MNSISIRHQLLKLANFLQSENTKIFMDKFGDKDQSEVKALADRAFLIFSTWKEYDKYRELLASIGSWEEMISFIGRCESALEKITSKVVSLGLPQNVAGDMGRQYLHKYLGELDSTIFLDRLSNVSSKGEFVALLRGEKKKEELPPELEGKDLSGFGKDYLGWIIKILEASKSGGEAHRVDDIISLAKTFRSSEMKLNKKISEFGTYSEASKYLDENSGVSKPAYIESIRNLAQLDNMSKIIYDDERWTVVLIGSAVGGQWWGRDTDFCISSIEDNLFGSYAVTSNIDPYFIIDKFAKSSDKMRKFTVAMKYADDGSFSISDDKSTITDATNQSINLEEIRTYLGKDIDKIFGAINSSARERKESLGKQNNKVIKQKIAEWDIDFIKKYRKEITSSDSLCTILLDNLKSEKDLYLIKDVFDIKVQESDPIFFIQEYSKYPTLDSYLKIAAEKAFQREPVQVLGNITSNFILESEIKYYLPYLEQSIDSFLKLNPINIAPYKREAVTREDKLFGGMKTQYSQFLYDLINSKYTEPYREKIIKTVINYDPIASVDYFNHNQKALPYLDYLAAKVMEIDPEFFEKIESDTFFIVYKEFFSKYRKKPFQESFISRKLKQLGKALRSFGHEEGNDILKLSGIK